MNEQENRIKELEDRVAGLETNVNNNKNRNKSVRVILGIIIGVFLLMTAIGIIQFVSAG